MVKNIDLLHFTTPNRIKQAITQNSPLKTSILSFFFFWLRWVFTATHGLSLAVENGGYSSLQCAGFSLRWLLLLQNRGSRHAGFSICSTRAQQLWLTGSRAQAQQLWCTGLVAPRHVASSRTRARTRVPCIGRRILQHCTTREIPKQVFFWELIIHTQFKSVQ